MGRLAGVATPTIDEVYAFPALRVGAATTTRTRLAQAAARARIKERLA
jgi:hypothetical protein